MLFRSPYGQSYTGSPKDIHDQVKADAIASGGTYNPFEGQGINQSSPSNYNANNANYSFQDKANNYFDFLIHHYLIMILNFQLVLFVDKSHHLFYQHFDNLQYHLL